jgi:hypothetical protein
MCLDPNNGWAVHATTVAFEYANLEQGYYLYGVKTAAAEIKTG